MKIAARLCPVCHGSRWLCEVHLPLRWRHDDCAAAGVPCVCRRAAAARWLRMVDAAQVSSVREIDRRSFERHNRRGVERRSPGAAGGLPVERRAGERRHHDRRAAMA
jgi:hypothetical protein